MEEASADNRDDLSHLKIEDNSKMLCVGLYILWLFAIQDFTSPFPSVSV